MRQSKPQGHFQREREDIHRFQNSQGPDEPESLNPGSLRQEWKNIFHGPKLLHGNQAALQGLQGRASRYFGPASDRLSSQEKSDIGHKRVFGRHRPEQQVCGAG